MKFVTAELDDFDNLVRPPETLIAHMDFLSTMIMGVHEKYISECEKFVG